MEGYYNMRHRPIVIGVFVSALAFVAALSFFLIGVGTTHAATPDSSSFNPTVTVVNCDNFTIGDTQVDAHVGTNGCPDNTTPGAAADNHNTLTIPAPGLNFSSIVTFAPSGTVITPGTSIPAGYKVGGILSQTSLGVANAVCGTTNIGVGFTFYNVALPNNATTVRDSTNIAWPRIDGGGDRFGAWSVGTGHTYVAGVTLSGNGGSINPTVTTFNVSNTLIKTGDHIWIDDEEMLVTAGGGTTTITVTRAINGTTAATHLDGASIQQFAGDGDGVPVTSGDAVHADGTTLAIQNYPSYLLDAFDADFVPGVSDGPAQPVVPLAAYGGLTHVVSDWIPLYLVQFGKASSSHGFGSPSNLPAPLNLMGNDSLGQPQVAVLNDPTSTVTSKSLITDFCAPLTTETVLLGTAFDPNNTSSTVVRATNQTCSGTPPTGCTTAFTLTYAASQRDLDQDNIDNATDTCPANVNTSTDDASGINTACLTLPQNVSCDAANNDRDCDGFLNRQDNCPQVANGVLDGSGNPNPGNANLQTDTEVAKPADNGPRTDSIGDACDTGSATFLQNGHSVTVSLSPTVANGRYIAKGIVNAKCIGGTDADGDGYCAQDQDIGTDNNNLRHKAWSGGLLQIDNDGDKFSTFQETYNGTDATKNCAQDSIANNEAPLDNWPLDFNDDQSVKSGDLSKYGALGVLNTVANTPAKQRLDLNDDGQVTTADLSKFAALGVFNSHCTPPSPFQQ
jgi:hypothetical protein